MRKLRKSSPTLSETLGEESLNQLLDSLFPRSLSGLDNSVLSETPPLEEEEEINVSVIEVIRLVKKHPFRNAAPGPDNIKAAVWKKVPEIVLGHLVNLFTLCLRIGILPKSWESHFGSNSKGDRHCRGRHKGSSNMPS